MSDVDRLRQMVCRLEAENVAIKIELHRRREEVIELKRELEQARVQRITHEAVPARYDYQDEELKPK